MNKVRLLSKITLAASVSLALAFTFSCSSDGDGGGGAKGASVSHCGETYETVVIGNQTWMARNLNCNISGSLCYGNNSSNCNKYGRLYNWEMAKTACPSGWHLPTFEELDYLTDIGAGGYDTAGKHLKAKSGWDNYEDEDGKTKSGNGLDTYGFAALPGGMGYNSEFGGAGTYGGWWGAYDGHEVCKRYWDVDCDALDWDDWDYEYYSNSANRWMMASDYEFLDWDDMRDKSQFYSVRCIKN